MLVAATADPAGARSFFIYARLVRFPKNVVDPNCR